MTYTAFISRITNIRPHPDPKTLRLKLGTVCNQQIVLGMPYPEEGQIGIFFPVDGRLSDQFLTANNLVGTIDPVTKERKGGFFDINGKVRAQSFRGAKSWGYWTPLVSLEFTGADLTTLAEGMTVTDLNGIKICEKYVNARTQAAAAQNKKRPEEKVKYPLFHEHIDTAKLEYYINDLKKGDVLVITEKLHGTSGRTANTVQTRQSRIGLLINNILKRRFIQPTRSWQYVTGTRKVIKDFNNPNDYGYFGADETFRKTAHDLFTEKLHKGETVYYEIVGWASETRPISSCQNAAKIKQDKDFAKKWGTEITFHYGCPTGTTRVYVYRITTTNEDGIETDYAWDTIKRRCSEMGVEHVPEIDRFIYEGDKDQLLSYLTDIITDEPSTLTNAHIMEGVVVRVDGSEPLFYKIKSHAFGVLEGYLKEDNVIDLEEAQEAAEA